MIGLNGISIPEISTPSDKVNYAHLVAPGAAQRVADGCYGARDYLPRVIVKVIDKYIPRKPLRVTLTSDRISAQYARIQVIEELKELDLRRKPEIFFNANEKESDLVVNLDDPQLLSSS